MKLKEAIKKVKYLNHWRRGGKGEMPDPRESGIAIDTVLNGLKQKDKIIDDLKEKAKLDYILYKNLEEENKNLNDLVNAGTGELKFKNLQVKTLKTALGEIETVTNDKIKGDS